MIFNNILMFCHHIFHLGFLCPRLKSRPGDRYVEFHYHLALLPKYFIQFQMSTTGNLGRSLTSFGVSNFDGELGGEAGGERRAKKRKSEKGGKKKKFKIKKKKF